MDRWHGKTAVVTGASAGIGAATALALANSGLKVIGLARRPHLVDKLQIDVTGKGSITSRLCDVSKTEDVSDTFRWIEDNFGGVDILVNNAALLTPGHITEAGSHPLSEEQILYELDVNIKGVVLCTRHAVASMNKGPGREGHVININSIAGHYIPFSDIFNVYPSTKYAITAFTRSLGGELAQFNKHIKTTSISPGMVATDLTKNSLIPGLQGAAARAPALRPADVAGAVLYVVATPPNVNISELTIQPVGEKRL